MMMRPGGYFQSRPRDWPSSYTWAEKKEGNIYNNVTNTHTIEFAQSINTRRKHLLRLGTKETKLRKVKKKTVQETTPRTIFILHVPGCIMPLECVKTLRYIFFFVYLIILTNGRRAKELGVPVETPPARRSDNKKGLKGGKKIFERKAESRKRRKKEKEDNLFFFFLQEGGVISSDCVVQKEVTKRLTARQNQMIDEMWCKPVSLPLYSFTQHELQLSTVWEKGDLKSLCLV